MWVCRGNRGHWPTTYPHERQLTMRKNVLAALLAGLLALGAVACEADDVGEEPADDGVEDELDTEDDLDDDFDDDVEDDVDDDMDDDFDDDDEDL